jgi:hypothetical protein
MENYDLKEKLKRDNALKSYQKIAKIKGKDIYYNPKTREIAQEEGEGHEYLVEVKDTRILKQATDIVKNLNLEN